MCPISTPYLGAGLRGAITAVCWMRREDEPGEILFFGTENGFLVCWRQHEQQFRELWVQQLALPSEVTSIAIDSPSERLAVSNRNGLIQVWSFDAVLRPGVIFSTRLAGVVPKTVAFTDATNPNRDLLVFGLHDGQL